MAFLCGSPGASWLGRSVATVKTARAASIVPAAGQQTPMVISTAHCGLWWAHNWRMWDSGSLPGKGPLKNNLEPPTEKG